MRYISTRGEGIEKKSAQAIIQGLAGDKGLFVPVDIPKISLNPDQLKGKSYQEIAKVVLKLFFDDFSDEEIAYCVENAYDEKFEDSEIAPIKNVGDVDILELFHGKTAAFKDMALSILPYLLTTSMKKENEKSKICILTATSGDTGKAALEGFADVPGTEIIVFYPNAGVSKVQERQMTTQEGNNVHVFAINGNFDNAQSGVKSIFNNREIEAKLAGQGIKLSSANSINIGRLVPQVAYYVYAYVKMLERGEIKAREKINAVVPTGNFGNILAAYYAKAVGIPYDKFICASNENKVLTDFIRTGEYNIRREFTLTNSPSMDILISSNLERLLYHISGGDVSEVGKLMTDLEKDKKYVINDKMREELRDFYGDFATQKETLATIREVYEKYGYVLDTHTAVAYAVYEKYKAATGDKNKTVIVSTASPYKFADSVATAIGIQPSENGFENIKLVFEKTGCKVPKELKNLEEKEILHRRVIDVEEMNQVVLTSVQSV